MAAAAILFLVYFRFSHRRLVEFSVLYISGRFGHVWPISSKVIALDRVFHLSWKMPILPQNNPIFGGLYPEDEIFPTFL